MLGEIPENGSPIYLDGFSTTPLAPEAKEAMLGAWSLTGNAGSPHWAGGVAAKTLARASEAVSELIVESPNELVFTPGATEADNLGITGVAIYLLRSV